MVTVQDTVKVKVNVKSIDNFWTTFLIFFAMCNASICAEASNQAWSVFPVRCRSPLCTVFENE